MSTATTTVAVRREPELLGQTVVVIGGSAGIGLETARRARAEGARVILTGRNPERLQLAAAELEALSTAAFDANDAAALERFFGSLPATIDHVMVTAGQPHYGRLLDMDLEQASCGLNPMAHNVDIGRRNARQQCAGLCQALLRRAPRQTSYAGLVLALVSGRAAILQESTEPRCQAAFHSAFSALGNG